MPSPSITLGRDDLWPASSQRFLVERLRAGMWRALSGYALDTVGFAFGAMAMAGAALPARMRLDREIDGYLLWSHECVRNCAQSSERKKNE